MCGHVFPIKFIIGYPSKQPAQTTKDNVQSKHVYNNHQDIVIRDDQYMLKLLPTNDTDDENDDEKAPITDSQQIQSKEYYNLLEESLQDRNQHKDVDNQTEATRELPEAEVEDHALHIERSQIRSS